MNPHDTQPLWLSESTSGGRGFSWSVKGFSSSDAATTLVFQTNMVERRRAAGRMTGRYAQDIANVVVYWHFVAITAVITSNAPI